MAPTKARAEGIDRRVKWALLVVSLATVVILGATAILENGVAEWRVLRKQYARILKDKATDQVGEAIARQFDVRIDQLVLPELRSVDRCVTCHTGTVDPRMVDQPQPFRTHPGDYLTLHEPAKFGCTSCHRGQGRATEKADAHGDVEHWDDPMLSKEHLATACSRCHAEDDLAGRGGLFELAGGEDGPPAGVALFTEGRDLLGERGCLGCHLVGGKGGALGPDLSGVGDKTRHEFDFTHVADDGGGGEPLTVARWLKAHFIEPERVSPGTMMPAVGSDDEADALTAYMLSLRGQVPALRAARLSAAAAPSGAQLYDLYCAACHGPSGDQSLDPQLVTPQLRNADALGTTGDDYYRLIISSGRSSTIMPAWREGAGGLSRDEIDRIIGYIRSWEPGGAATRDVDSRLGDSRNGRIYYEGLCANCHGRRGEGGIGNTLNSQTFLAVTSDEFLAETVIRGRPGTAMPSWKELPAQAVSDILAYIRTWQGEAPSFDDVRRDVARIPRSRLERIGERLYEGSCAGCHGPSGEGGIGVRLNTPSLLRAVDDEYLYRALVEGRPSTAMPAWRHLRSEDLAALLAHLRSWQRGGRQRLRDAPPSGDFLVGEVFYRTSCAGCHGMQGQGGVGPQLANPVLLGSATDEQLYHWIGHGRTGTAMVGFLAEEQGPVTLARDEIADVISYLRYLGTREERVIKRTGVGNPYLGGQIFTGNCASCHGLDGEGASGPQLNNASFLRSASDGFLAATMVLGRTGTPMRSMIHGQAGLAQIAPEQVQDVIAYMRLWEFPETWKKPRSMAELSLRALTAGKRSYDQYCAGCHGLEGLGQQEGSGYFAPALNNPEFLDAASDGYLMATIARGRRGTPMRPFGEGTGGIVSLDSEQISDIVSYIRSWQTRTP